MTSEDDGFKSLPALRRCSSVGRALESRGVAREVGGSSPSAATKGLINEAVFGR